MFNPKQHKTILVRILKEIYSDPEVRTSLGFKGGTAAYLFYDLPRLSVDLDFDLLDEAQKKAVIEKIPLILSKFGVVVENIEKRNTLFFLLRYQLDNRNIKVEISKRSTKSSFELKNYLGISVLVMKKDDMTANKLVAIIERKKLASRDFFDLWFFLNNDWQINPEVIKERTGLTVSQVIKKAIKIVEKVNNRSLLHGIGELVEAKQKIWIKNKLKEELLFNLKLYLKP